MFDPVEDTLVLVSGGVSTLPLDKYFCLTSSVVKGAPVLRMAVDEAVDDSVEVFESELAERVDFLCPASEALLVGAAVLLAAVFRCVCCNDVTDSSDSSGLEMA